MVPGVIGYILEYRGGLLEPPGGNWASWAQLVEEERRPRGSRVPLPPKSELDKEEGRRPPFLSPSLLPSPLLVQQGREGVLLPVGVGLLLAGRLCPPCSFIYGAKGAP